MVEKMGEGVEGMGRGTVGDGGGEREGKRSERGVGEIEIWLWLRPLLCCGAPLLGEF